MPHLHALLIGIDSYAPGTRVPSLRGCVADVEALQTQLTRRFEAPPDRVLLLTNEQATLDSVIEAWRTHLRDGVAPGDVAFVHYSGHGSQATSADPSEADGLDETLALWDSRLPGRTDLRDKQIARLIGEVEARGAQVILFLDCCHAGGATRADEAGAVRACPPDLRPHLDVESPLAVSRTRGDVPVPELSPGSPASQRHVLLAACLDEEKARETLTEGSWHGAATWCFLRALDSADASTTWADIHAQLLASVRTLNAHQTPQLSGPRSTLLWGGAGQVSSAPLLVLAVEGRERVQLDGGAAIGMTEGARVAVLSHDAQASGPPLAVGTVTTSTAESAWATLESPTTVPIASRARILSYGYASPVYPVRVDDAEVIAALARSETRFVRVTTSPAAPFAVSLAAGRYHLVDPTGEPLVAEQPPGGHAGALRALQLLEHLAIYRNVRSLRNRAANPVLAGMLEVGEPVAAKASRNSYAAVGEAQPLPRRGDVPLARSGQAIAFSVTNKSQQRLFVTVLRLGLDSSIRKVEPIEERQTTLPAGRTLFVRDHIEVPPLTADEGIVLYKVLATATPVSFDALLLPPIGQGSATRAAPVRDAGPLSALLDALRRTGTRPAASEVAEDLWFTRDVLMAIGNGQ